MTGALLGVAMVCLVVAAGLVIAAALGIRTIAELAIATYVIGFAEIVVLALLLSTFDTLTRSALVVGAGMFLAGSIGVWLLTGARRPRLPSRDVLLPRRIPTGPVAVLAAIVALALGYVVGLIVGTPPNGWDQLNYHLARAALWLQANGVGYIQGAYDARINSYPPNGEIGLAFTLGVTRHEMFAGAVALTAALACAVGVFAIARRLGLEPREALMGALLFLTLPIVLLQASSTKNDIVVASFLVSAAVLVLGSSRGEIWLASLATALAVGTKFTAFYGGLVLLALALVATPVSRRWLRVAAIAAGTGLGLYWYAVNAVETGMLLGDTSSIPGLTAPLKPRENLVEAFGLAVDWIDLSGAKRADIVLYLAAAFLVAAGLALRQRSESNRGRSAFGAALLVASPLLLYVLTTQVGRPVLVRLHDALGEPQAYIPGDGDPNSSPALASDTGSWFGPVGLLLAIGVGVAAVILVRRGSLPRSAVVCATAPLVWTLLVGLSLTYHPWQGRFFLFPMALSASLWGLTLRAPPVAWAVTALSAVTAFLSLVHYAEKPSGLRLLNREDTASVWKLERWQVQSQHDPMIGPVLRFLDEEVPARDSIALALGANDFGYPAFGPRLQRAVELVPFGASGREVRTTWLFANPERAPEIDRVCWAEAFQSGNGTVFRRQAESC